LTLNNVDEMLREKNLVGSFDELIDLVEVNMELT
jgi:hypothetical protein